MWSWTFTCLFNQRLDALSGEKVAICQPSPFNCSSPRFDVDPNAPQDWSLFLEKKRKELKRLNGVYHTLLKNAGVDVRGAQRAQCGGY